MVGVRTQVAHPPVFCARWPHELTDKGRGTEKAIRKGSDFRPRAFSGVDFGRKADTHAQWCCLGRQDVIVLQESA